MKQLLREFSNDEHVLRPRVPTLQLLLYGDYTCVRTAKFDLAIRAVLGAVPEDVAYIYRHFPSDPIGQQAAECAVAAAAQGRFWAMHACLLAHPTQLDDASLVEHAVSVQLDVSRFLRDRAGPVPRRKVVGDQRRGLSAGIDRTPSIFLGGQPLSRDLTVEALLRHLKTA